jgi:hypothetical protein
VDIGRAGSFDHAPIAPRRSDELSGSILRQEVPQSCWVLLAEQVPAGRPAFARTALLQAGLLAVAAWSPELLARRQLRVG